MPELKFLASYFINIEKSYSFVKTEFFLIKKYFLDKGESTVYTSNEAILRYLIYIQVNNHTLLLNITEQRRCQLLVQWLRVFLCIEVIGTLLRKNGQYYVMCRKQTLRKSI